MNMFQKSCLRAIRNDSYIGLSYKRYKNSSDYICFSNLWRRNGHASSYRNAHSFVSFCWSIPWRGESLSGRGDAVGSHHHLF